MQFATICTVQYTLRTARARYVCACALHVGQRVPVVQHFKSMERLTGQWAAYLCMPLAAPCTASIVCVASDEDGYSIVQ